MAVGHTRSDQAETVLFRFLRGAATAGLAGIRPITADGIVRPLLSIERAEVEQFLREHGIPWRDDSTNASPRFARNRIRHVLLPQLARDWNPSIVPTLAHAADWALAEEAYWKTEIEGLAAGRVVERDGAFLLRAGALSQLPLAVARRLVRYVLGKVRGDLRRIDFGHIASILDLASQPGGCGKVQVPGVEVCRSFEWLRIAVPRPVTGYCLPVFAPGCFKVPAAGLELSLELIEKAETSEQLDYVYNSGMRGLNWRSLSGSLELRNWRAGDRYQPVGSTGDKKIKTLFQQARIPLWERPCWPVLTDGAAIVWTRQFGPAAGVAAGSGAKVVLRVAETGESGIWIGQASVYKGKAGTEVS